MFRKSHLRYFIVINEINRINKLSNFNRDEIFCLLRNKILL